MARDASDVLYIAPDDIVDGHLMQDGSIVDNVCGNCLRRLDNFGE